MAATFDPKTAPAVTFNARNADAYEQVILNPAVGASNGQRAGKNFNLWL
jgi:hypothetical protein